MDYLNDYMFPNNCCPGTEEMDRNCGGSFEAIFYRDKDDDPCWQYKCGKCGQIFGDESEYFEKMMDVTSVRARRINEMFEVQSGGG